MHVVDWVHSEAIVSVVSTGTSDAKKQLKKLIPDGVVTENTDPNHIYENMCGGIFQNYNTPAVLNFKNRARAWQENINERLKRFDIVGTRFQYAMDKHELVFFTACLVLVQYYIENGRPLNSVL